MDLYLSCVVESAATSLGGKEILTESLTHKARYLL